MYNSLLPGTVKSNGLQILTVTLNVCSVCLCGCVCVCVWNCVCVCVCNLGNTELQAQAENWRLDDDDDSVYLSWKLFQLAGSSGWIILAGGRGGRRGILRASSLLTHCCMQCEKFPLKIPGKEKKRGLRSCAVLLIFNTLMPNVYFCTSIFIL